MFSKESLSYERIFMRKGLIRFLISIRERRIVQIAQKTMVSVFPFILLATVTLIFSETFFNRGGYINHLFKISDWFPYFNLIGRTVSNFALLIGGLTGSATCYFAAKFTVMSYKCTSRTAGITALIFSLIINSRAIFDADINDGELTRINLTTSFNLFFTICIGFLIGQIFRRFSPSDNQILDENSTYRPRSIRPILISFIIAVTCNMLYTIGAQYNIFSSIETYIGAFFTVSSGLFQSVINAILRSLSAWVGNSSPYTEIVFDTDAKALANLNAALSNKGTGSIPYLFSVTNLYTSYGALAGLGGVLALVVAVIWKSSSDRNKNIAVRCIFPALFNHGSPVMLGIPVALNVIYLVPFIIAPIINVLVAAILLYFKVIPPSVYPVPTGTPSILYAFVGSAGSLRTLALAILLFAMDVLIYIPFVKLDDRLHDMILSSEMEGGNDEEQR